MPPQIMQTNTLCAQSHAYNKHTNTQTCNTHTHTETPKTPSSLPPSLPYLPVLCACAKLAYVHLARPALLGGWTPAYLLLGVGREVPLVVGARA